MTTALLAYAGQETGAQRRVSPQAHCARKVARRAEVTVMAIVDKGDLAVLTGIPHALDCPECDGQITIHVAGTVPPRCARCAARRRVASSARSRARTIANARREGEGCR